MTRSAIVLALGALLYAFPAYPQVDHRYPHLETVSPARSAAPTETRRKPKARHTRKAVRTRHARPDAAPRGCLEPGTAALLAGLERACGRQQVVKTCCTGCRMTFSPRRVSWHAKRRAFDVRATSASGKQCAVAYLAAQGRGLVLTYGRRDLSMVVHADTGSYVARRHIAHTDEHEPPVQVASIGPDMLGDTETDASRETAWAVDGLTFASEVAARERRVAEARSYLVSTAQPGFTMTVLGVARSMECFHPDFAIALADAVREARAAGLSSAGVGSACRLPYLGVGGFRDKFNSLHAYGLAADMRGVGAARTPAARLWFKIATKHGLKNPYGWRHRAEWNHYQLVPMKAVASGHKMRNYVRRDRYVDLRSMWRAAPARGR